MLIYWIETSENHILGRHGCEVKCSVPSRDLRRYGTTSSYVIEVITDKHGLLKYISVCICRLRPYLRVLGLERSRQISISRCLWSPSLGNQNICRIKRIIAGYGP